MPWVGAIARALQTAFVDRDSQESRARALETIANRCKNPGWPTLVVYPEGTTTNGTCLIDFHRGAFNPGYPVQPAVIKFGGKHYTPCWPPGGSTAKACWELLCQFYNRMEVEYLPVMYPLSGEEPEQFAERVQAACAKALNVPICRNSKEKLNIALNKKRL